jgi:predicted lipoprotein
MKQWFHGLAILLLSLTVGSCTPWTVRPIGSETDDAANPSALTPAAYVDSIWSTKLLPAVLTAAVDARTLLDVLTASPQEAFENYAHKAASGPAYFIVKGQGVVVSIDTSSRMGLALVDIAPLDQRPDLSIQIGPVLRGTSLRDATGIVRFSDFVNQLQFADVGNELNAKVLKTVLDPLDKAALEGRVVRFAGTLAAEEGAAPPLRELLPVELVVKEQP